ncbi:FAD/NAD(P)-binding domain-containing protein [Wolfiporia cocos MD-104 SS10]|uniref:FAD/NAD(P)-binding domain-containing protein n=1 Tax=Wolfiporia cocos (strain MD-104) TaxID=742152 RepID=A0A2H3JPF3_WOLCO|nr:FAD/NAD(P)-binding domain-containing protein [Wolfiporia cocos MD-104 SS10]
MSDLKHIVETWLHQFARAAEAGDAGAVTQAILPHGWLRDMLILTWDMRALEGHARISAYLANTLAPAQMYNFELDNETGMQPEVVLHDGVGGGFRFETPTRRGRGYVRLLKDAHGEWKALALFLMLDQIKNHEELGPELGTYEGHTLAWEDVNKARRARIENDPYVIVMGAGQTGLNIAARLKYLDIPTIVLEKKNRVGDQWRERYPTLSLHSIRSHHTLAYQPYPKNWPIFTPRDKMADWLEQYSVSQDLVVWTNSYVKNGGTYDPVKNRWSIIVDHNGVEVELHPAHIVSAVGSTGPPHVPDAPGRESFKGLAIHSSQYPGGEQFSGKHTIVVGACQSASDIALDLAFRGAKTVTMVQRSTTCVVSIDTAAGAEAALYPDGVPLEVSDIKFNAIPFGLGKQIAREENQWAKETVLHTKLKNSGLNLNMGDNGAGHVFLIYERLGGYWWDVGLADYIETGKVKIKQGVEVKRFDESGIVFTDDTKLPADLVLFATGWHDPRETLKDMFGAEMIDRTKPAWGLDEEGEINGCCRPTGQPGLWYAGGDFATTRFYSKPLALQIKAQQVGLISNA